MHSCIIKVTDLHVSGAVQKIMPPVLNWITDNHMHIDPLNGMGIEAAKRFKRAGGTHLFMVNKMSKDLGVKIVKGEDFKEVFERTIRIAEEIRSTVGLGVYVVIGIHPAEYVHLCEELGISKALEIGCDALEVAREIIGAGSAVALGEIGRPHYPVEEAIMRSCMQLLSRAMVLARDHGFPIQLHTEGASPELYDELKKTALKAGYPLKGLIKHFSGGDSVALAEKMGFVPSVLATRKNLDKIDGKSFLMESDYIDDLRRPGAVTGPKSVPRQTIRMIEDGKWSHEQAIKTHKDLVEETYGLELK